MHHRLLCKKNTFLFWWLLGLLLLQSCANFRLSRQYVLEKNEPPYVWRKIKGPVGQVGVLPVEVRINSILNENLKPVLDSLAITINQKADWPSNYVRLQAPDLPADEAPEVYIGGPETVEFQGDREDPQLKIESKSHSEAGPIVVYLQEPSQKWKERFQQTLADKGLQYGVYLCLRVVELYPLQKDWKGNKVMPLGTGYAKPLPWLTSLGESVETIALEGVLLNKEGKILAAAAEGLYAQPTNFWVSVVGLKQAIDADKLGTLFDSRREDLSQQPYVWQAGLQNLLANLTGNQALLLLH